MCFNVPTELYKQFIILTNFVLNQQKKNVLYYYGNFLSLIKHEASREIEL